MTSTMETQAPVPLKGKLNHVKNLLDGANKRLQVEASKYGEIFTTKTSAGGAGGGPSEGQHNAPGKQNGGRATHDQVPADLRRTITDISTIQSVLSCPIFGQIVNVTDSLDKLSYHLNLRPSIGPVDINIDSNGELILAPPMEPASFNNLINSHLDELSPQSQQANSSPQISSSQAQDCLSMQQNVLVNGNNVNGNGVGATNSMLLESHHNQMRTNGKHTNYNNTTSRQTSDGDPQDENNPRNIALAPGYNSHNINQQTNSIAEQQQQLSSFTSTSSGPISPIQQTQQSRQPAEFNNEKLVSSGAGDGQANQVNGNRRKRSQTSSKVQSVAAVFENHIAESSENRRLYKANANYALNQMDQADARKQSFERYFEPSDNHDSQTLGYTNEMYRTTGELSGAALDGSRGVDVMDYKKLSLNETVANSAYANNSQLAPMGGKPSSMEAPVGKRIVSSQQRVSPSTSAGSTVPLGDECDSGTSSFRSQAAKGNLNSPQSHKPIPQLDEDSPHVDSSLDQELIEKLSPDMERIKVTLEKDANNSLGITIAGYVCEDEEISGIFIKSITPDSPADRSGKIKILDQIFAVNGQEILGFSNDKAVDVLRRDTSRKVTLELMRYLVESKYRKLQTLLNRAEPKVQQSTAGSERKLSGGERQMASQNNGAQMTSVSTDLIRAQPGLGANSPRRTSQSSATTENRLNESIYNNSSAIYATNAQQQQQQQQANGASYAAGDLGNKQQEKKPVAAQRGASGTTGAIASNKVIETKQGARNTIDIRSPMCQTATATYVNEVSDMMMTSNQAFNGGGAAAAAAVAANSAGMANRSAVERQKQEAAEEFGHLVKTEKLEWERDVQIVELYRESTQSLGFTVKDYANPKDSQQSIFMIVLITPGGIAERDGRLSVGDLLVFVDDTNLEGASPNEAVRALRRTSGQVRLGVLKYKRDY